MVVLILVAGTTFACILFSYFFLWTVRPDVWPSTVAALPHVGWGGAAAALYILSSLAIGAAGRWLADPPRRSAWPMRVALLVAIPLLVAAATIEILGQRSAGVSPSATSYGAAVFALASWHGFFAAVLAVMALYTVARSLAGRLSGTRRVTFDNTRLLWHYAVAQGLLSLAVVHLFPRATG
jgi:cytochrome c oxidase subunit I+III